MNCCPGIRNFLGILVGLMLAGGFFMAVSQRPVAADKEEQVKLLRHVVLFKFKDSSSAADIQKVDDEFREVPSKLPAGPEL